MNPIRLLKNCFIDLLLKLSGTWVGAPKDPDWPEVSHWQKEDSKLKP